MLILAKNRLKDPAAGYARSFLTQMEQVMGTCLDASIKVVSNAGGLSPARLAERVEELADRLGLSPKVAYVEGDDLLGRLEELRAAGHDFANLDTGEPLGSRSMLTANAYLGGFGIKEALGRGADIVVTGRVTDALPALLGRAGSEVVYACGPMPQRWSAHALIPKPAKASADGGSAAQPMCPCP